MNAPFLRKYRSHDRCVTLLPLLDRIRLDVFHFAVLLDDRGHRSVRAVREPALARRINLFPQSFPEHQGEGGVG